MCKVLWSFNILRRYHIHSSLAVGKVTNRNEVHGDIYSFYSSLFNKYMAVYKFAKIMDYALPSKRNICSGHFEDKPTTLKSATSICSDLTSCYRHWLVYNGDFILLLQRVLPNIPETWTAIYNNYCIAESVPGNLIHYIRHRRRDLEFITVDSAQLGHFDSAHFWLG